MKIGKWTAKTLLVGAACLSFLTSGQALADGKDGEGAELTISADGKSAKLKVKGDIDKTYEKLDFEKLVVKMSGSGDIKLEGKVKVLEVDITGSGEVDAEKLEAEEVELDMSGSGEVSVTASKSFEIDASGSATIELYGSGDIKRRSLSGSVKIKDHRKK